MLEIYLNEIIAGVAILVLIVIYFMIKKTQQEHRVVQEEKESIKEEKTPKALIKLNRVKRDIPLHSKITKEDFKEFAGQRILVAEDNIINQKVISGLLSDSDIEVVFADDGEFLLEILEKDSNFNFILMDAHMPRVDGFEATRRIRENPNYNHIIIIALSGDTSENDIKKMSDSGMEEHLEKPLRIDDMYDVLYAYTNPSKATFKELDIETGLNICANDVEFYHEILDEFTHKYFDSASKLKKYINEDEILKADRHLLDISGISANIGANNISKISLKLKSAVSKCEDENYINLLIEYEKSLLNLLKEIKKYKAKKL